MHTNQLPMSFCLFLENVALPHAICAYAGFFMYVGLTKMKCVVWYSEILYLLGQFTVHLMLM